MVEGKIHVLLVDDDDQMRGAARRVLHSHGYTVVDVADPRQALDILRDKSLDVALVVTDVVMPHMDGWSLAVAARGLRPELRVLYMSGYPELPVGRAGAMAPTDALLRKPFSPNALASAVRRALG